jgi:hypothetical protein
MQGLNETPDEGGEEGTPESSSSESIMGSNGGEGSKAQADKLGHMAVEIGQVQPGILGEEPFLSFPFF